MNNRLVKIILIIVVLVIIGGITLKHVNVETEKYSSKEDKTLSLYFDDRYEFDSRISNIKIERISSNKTGTKEKDNLVLKTIGKDNKKVVARGCGYAIVTLDDGSMINVSVEPAPISIIMLTGQSNNEGRLAEGQTVDEVKQQCVEVKGGQAYDSYGVSDNEICREVKWVDNKIDDLDITNYEMYLPESLYDNTKNKDYNRTDTITDEKRRVGKTGIDSALAYEWNRITGEKVWIINAAHHGSSITTWDPDIQEKNNNFWQAVKLFQSAEEIMNKEIEAGHYILSHKGVIWFQGGRDFRMEADTYRKKYYRIHDRMKKELGGTGLKFMEKELEFDAIIMVRASLDNPHNDNDFLLTGPRVAQYYMTTTNEREDIIMGSQIEELWYSDDAVETYFTDIYEKDNSFSSSYPTVSKQLHMPKTMAEVHNGFHFTQIGYNEIGFDVARNICEEMGYIKKTKERPVSIELVFEDGIKSRNGETVVIEKGEYVPFVVKVAPSSFQNDVIIRCSENVSYKPNGVIITNDEGGYIEVRAGNQTEFVKITGKKF